MPEYQFAVVQFLVPRAAARALDHQAIRASARAAGVLDSSFETSDKSVPPTMARMTAHRDLVPHIIDDWVRIAQLSRGDLVIAAAEAAKAGLDAIAPR